MASSKIEGIAAGIDDFARALAGSRANESATSMVAATDALGSMIRSAEVEPISLDSLLIAHRELTRDDALLGERQYAGRLRDMQNWIGGSDHSPRGAHYIPPPPDLVETLMVDLVAFTAREDLPVITQAAIATAQFESIHPFTDGNGRIGRALINAIFRRRRLNE